MEWRPDVLNVSLFLILIGGAIVRFVGIDFGLPLTIKSDEPIVVGGAMGMLERRSFEPDAFQWPNHLGIMATYLAYVVVTPLWHGMLAEQAINEVEIGYFHLIARSVTALFGIATIVLAYLIGKRFHRVAGVFAAALVAFMPDYVAESHYATPDMVLTATVLAVILAGMVYVEKPTTAWLLGISALTSLSIMAKYPGALGTVVIAAVVIAAGLRDRQWPRIVRHGALSLVAVPLFLFILSPSLFTNRHRTLRSLTNEARDSHPGADGLTFPEKLAFYWVEYFAATGPLLLLLSALGLWYVITRWQLQAIPLFIGVVFWVALSTFGLHWSRWGMPMYITPILLAALGAHFVVTQIQNRPLANRAVKASIAVIVGFALLTQVVVSIAVAAGFLRKDVRLNALNDLDQKGITADNSVYEGYTPFFPDNLRTIWDDFAIEGGQLVPLSGDTEYAIISSSVFGRFLDEERYPEEVEFYELLDQFPVVAEYGPKSPEVRVPLSNIRLLGAIQSLGETALGASSGPVIRVFEIAPDSF